jgi:flavin-dependent dehydrogenase
LPEFDVIIIGAGPAGCVAAVSLARREHRVALVEQHRFPRDKVCGECLSALGIDVLNRLDLRQSLVCSRPAQLTRAELIAPGGATANIELPRPMWGITRAALDTALLESARSAGATIIQPARYEGGAIRDLVANNTRPISTRWTIRADGKATDITTADLGVKAHFKHVASPTDTIALFGLNGHYVGVAPVEGRKWNLAMSVPVARVRACQGNIERLFDQMLSENRELRARMRRAARVSDWLTCPLPRFAVLRDWPANVIPVGNAAAALEPIGGEGMGLAMRSAELAADAIDRALRYEEPVDVTTLRREYQKLWTWRSRAARAIAVVMSRPGLARLLVSAIQCCEPAVKPALVPLGK